MTVANNLFSLIEELLTNSAHHFKDMISVLVRIQVYSMAGLGKNKIRMFGQIRNAGLMILSHKVGG